MRRAYICVARAHSRTCTHSRKHAHSRTHVSLRRPNARETYKILYEYKKFYKIQYINMKYLYSSHACLSSPPRGRESNWATVGPKPRPAAWPLPRLFRGGQARDGAEARTSMATAPPRGGPRPSWYVRVRGGPTRGESSHPTGSMGAAPPYTCGEPLGCVPAAAPTWLTSQGLWLGLLPQRLHCSGLW